LRRKPLRRGGRPDREVGVVENHLLDDASATLRTESLLEFHYQGYTLLDQPGMTATQTVKYYFQGNPVPSKENRSQLGGPFDDSYLFSDTIRLRDRVWSPCGASRRLNALTRLKVRNNDAKSGSGYTNTSAVDAEVETKKLKFEFGVDWRNC
jgi:hypothetical protein